MNNFDFTWIVALISIAGSFFNIKKIAVCFYLWAICETFCFIIDIKNQQCGRAFLDIFCLVMNIYGIVAWEKDKKAKKESIVQAEV